jgi:hypothetical protein
MEKFDNEIIRQWNNRMLRREPKSRFGGRRMEKWKNGMLEFWNFGIMDC